jgi:hypothetical protein
MMRRKSVFYSRPKGSFEGLENMKRHICHSREKEWAINQQNRSSCLGCRTVNVKEAAAENDESFDVFQSQISPVCLIRFWWFFFFFNLVYFRAPTAQHTHSIRFLPSFVVTWIPENGYFLCDVPIISLVARSNFLDLAGRSATALLN